MKLAWEEEFLSEILCQKDLKLQQIGEVKQRLKNMKVLIFLDDVEDLELLKTLVGQTDWFGNGSRIIVITQDRRLLKSHDIDLIYEVDFPTEDIALKMLCRSAFGQNSPPDGFKELALEVATLAGNLPLGLNVLGSSLRKKDKEEWVEMIPLLGNDWKGEIGKILKVCYNRLDSKYDQELFLHIACLFNGESVSCINDLLEGVYTRVHTRIKMLAEKSLIRITTPDETVQIHTLLHKLGRDIVRQESINDPGKRRFLVDVEDIREVLTYKTGTENVLGICLNKSDIDRNKPLLIDKNPFKGMRNLQFIKFYETRWRFLSTGLLESIVESFFDVFAPKTSVILKSHEGLVYLPPKLRLLHWVKYPGKYIPSNFEAEYLVELVMAGSKLKRLWEGTLPLQHLKKMDLSLSEDLKEIPNLSKAKNLKVLDLRCCSEPMDLPESLERLYLTQGSSLESFPGDRSLTASRWMENTHRVTHLTWNRCPLRCMPSNFRTEHLVELHMPFSKFEKLWEGVQLLENLESMNLSGCENLIEIPDLSKATKLKMLDMSFCRRLEVLPTDVNLESLEELNLYQCTRLRSFPQISKSISVLDLSWSAIEEVPCWIENMSNLEILDMMNCERLKNISPSIFKLRHLKEANFKNCTVLTSFSDASVVAKVACITDSLDFPQISTSNKELNLNRTAIEEIPSWIENMSKLKKLEMNSCRSLEVLPTDVNLESLEELSLSGCTRLRSFPQISTSIKKLDLKGTAIEEVPSWIENMSELQELDMVYCKSLKNISPSIFKLRHLKKARFMDCSKLTSFSDASVVATAARITDLPSDNLKYFNFNGCWSLDGNAQELIPGLSLPMNRVLPDREVPTYFTHRNSCGNSLIITLPQSSPSHQVLRFQAACIVVESEYCYYSRLEVHWRFRGLNGVKFCDIWPDSEMYFDYEGTDRLIVYNFDLADVELNSHQSELDYKDVEFEFFIRKYEIDVYWIAGYEIDGSYVKRCGVRLLNASSSPDDESNVKESGARSSEKEYKQQSGEECDAESGRCKKQMRMTVGTTEEPSNSLCGQIMADTELPPLNLELLLGSVQVSSRRKIPSSSVSRSNDFHGDGALPDLSLSLLYPCLEEEALGVDPMITEL